MNRYDNIYKYIMALLLLLYIGIMIFFSIITPDKTFSQSENRPLEQKPKFSLHSLVKGKFISNFEKYIADQFPFRDFWIGVKSEGERTLGKKENNEVYLGKDNYLIQKFKKPENDSLNNRVKAINSFDLSNPHMNKYFMLVPNSIKILENKLPSYAPNTDQLAYIDKIKKGLNKNIKFIDIYNTLYSKKNEYIFYKTDHHWTSKGAYYSYEKTGEYMGFVPHNNNYFNVKKVTDSFYGSLYSKSGFRHLTPDSIEIYLPKENDVQSVYYSDTNKKFNSIYFMDNLDKKDKYTIFLNGNHPLVKINTNVKNNKKLLVIKDSYANCFIPFLMGHYSEIYMVDLRYYNEDINTLIKDNNIDNSLILYNVNTFFEDESICNISQ
ncbi:DHHW family protein [Clostridium lundense]|uniref:DHHW family protein n=1 Tax=Clostridium lundense TaxID=319475 RepID=UPI0004847366|nr:DHHW family protein [Clostridium lundense]